MPGTDHVPATISKCSPHSSTSSSRPAVALPSPQLNAAIPTATAESDGFESYHPGCGFGVTDDSVAS